MPTTTVVRTIASDADDATVYETASPPYTETITTGDNHVPLKCGYRFQNVTVPPDAVLKSATFFIEIDIIQGSAINLSVNAIEDDNPSAFSSGSGDRVQFSQLLTVGVSDTITGISKTFDVLDIIQEVISLPGWASGNDIVMVCRATGFATALMPTFGTAREAILTIEYAEDTIHTGSTGSIALTGNAGESEILVPPVDLDGATGSIALVGNAAEQEAGDFETGVDGWVSVGAGGSVVSSTDQAKTGTHSLKWQTGTSTFGQARDTSRLAVEEGQRWRVFFSVYRTESAVPIQARILNQSAVPMAGTAFTLPAYSGEWRDFEIAYTIEPGVTHIGLGLIKANDATDIVVYIDAVSIPTVEIVTADAIIEVGSDAGTGSIALVGQQGSWNRTTVPDDLTYGGHGVYGGNGFYGGPELDQPASLGRLRVDIYNVAGEKLNVPPLTNIIASYTQRTNEIGSFEVSTAGSEEAAYAAELAYRIRVFHEGEGEVFRGIVEDHYWEDSIDGPRLTLKGPSIAGDFNYVNMLLGRAYEDATPLAILTDMVSLVPGWAVGTVGTPINATSSVSAEGASVWAAMRQLAERFHFHLRANLIEQTIDLGAFGDVSGLRFTNLPNYDPVQTDYPDVIPIRTVQVVKTSREIWNSLLPHGPGQGEAALTISDSTRTEPYEILTATAPDGRSLHYIEDAASVARYGRRQRVVADKNALPKEATEEALIAANNALYDGAATVLTESKDPVHTYRVSPGTMAHSDGGIHRFKLGDTAHLVYRGRAERLDGTGYLYLDVDEHLYISGYSRRITDSEDDWSIDVQNTLGRTLDPSSRLVEVMEAVWALQMEPYLVETAPPSGSEPVFDGIQEYSVGIDLTRVLWLRAATMTFTLDQSGGGDWTGTITINGEDVTAALGGPFATGVEHTVNIRPHLDRWMQNTIVFENSTDFSITESHNVRIISLSSLFGGP